MRIIIDIPEQFESDYKGDMFKDFFLRVICDIPKGIMCGNYEKETAEMLLKAFEESTPLDKIVEELETEYNNIPFQYEINYEDGVSDGLLKAIERVKAGGKV